MPVTWELKKVLSFLSKASCTPLLDLELHLHQQLYPTTLS